MVPPAGIEPALPKERDFESRASTSSARGATDTELRLYHGLEVSRKNDGAGSRGVFRPPESPSPGRPERRETACR